MARDYTKEWAIELDNGKKLFGFRSKKDAETALNLTSDWDYANV